MQHAPSVILHCLYRELRKIHGENYLQMNFVGLEDLSSELSKEAIFKSVVSFLY